MVPDPFKAIFWDNDGVLVDTERLYFQATREAAARIGFDLSQDLFRQYTLNEARGIWHLLSGVSEAEIETLKIFRNSRHQALLASESYIIPHVLPVIERLSTAFRMGIVTSSTPEHFAIVHSRTGLLPYFEFTLTNDCYKLSKPHPEPYLRALEITGLNPEECLVVEDSERGLRAARAAGLQCWVVPSDLTAGSDFSQAGRVLNSIEDLLELLPNG